MPLEGTYTVFLGDKPVLLQEGDIIFICPGILHSLVAPENGKRIILQIEWSVVSKIRDLNSILALISPVLTLTPQTAPDIYSDIYHLICQILSEYEEDSFLSEAVIYARMLDILSLAQPANAELTLLAQGQDAREALYGLARLLNTMQD